MSNYYCLMAGLPEIDMASHDTGLSVARLKEESSEVLTAADRRLASYFYLRYDCQNLVALMKAEDRDKVELSPLGNLTRDDLDDLILSARELNYNVSRYPAFLSEFAREYADNIQAEGYYADDDILVRYLTYCLTTCRNAFMRRWYALELNVNNVLTALIARRQGWALEPYVKGEGEVQELLRTSRAKDFDLTRLYDFAAPLMQIADEDDPVEKEKLTDRLRWTWLDEETFFEPFSFEAFFAYLTKVAMLERWARLDVEQGREAFRHIIDTLRAEAQVPEEFIR